MKIVYAVIKILILLAFVLLAATNTQTAVFNYVPGQSVSLPLIVLLLVFFMVGALFGVLAMFGRLLSLRNETHRLRREVKKNSHISIETPASADAGTTAVSADHTLNQG